MSQLFYQKFVSFFSGFIILVFMFLIGAEFMFFYSLSGDFIFYYSSIGVFGSLIVYTAKYYQEFQGFRETLSQGLYFPNSNNEKVLDPISKPLDMEVEDLPLKACLLYRNGHSFEHVSKALGLGHSEQARGELVKGLDTLLKEHKEHKIKKVKPK